MMVLAQIGSTMTAALKHLVSSASPTPNLKPPYQVLLIEQLGSILFEYYYCEGPIHLLSAATELFQSTLKLARISYGPSVPMALTHVADVLFAKYELDYDLDALAVSIKHYEMALDHPEILSDQRYNVTVGLAHAVYNRYRAFSCEEDCRTALTMLDSIQDQDADESSRAWRLIVVVLLKASESARSVVSVTSQDIHELLSALQRVPQTHLSRSRYLLYLVAKARVLWAMTVMTQQQDSCQKGFAAAQLGLRLSSKHAVVIQNLLQVELYDLHALESRYHWDDGHQHLNTGLQLAKHMHSSPLSEHNIYVRWYSLNCLARMAMVRASVEEDMEAIEEAVETMKQVVKMCPPSCIAYRALINHLAYTLGTYFDRSGRVTVLDDLISLKDIAPDITIQVSYLAANIAEALLLRAQVSGPRSFRRLIDQAVELCRARSNVPGFAEVDNTERVAIDLQMLHASRLQLQGDGRVDVDVDSMLSAAHRGLATKELGISPSGRIGYILAYTSASMYVAQTRGDDLPLLQAATILEREVSEEAMMSSVYCVDLLAAQADICITRSRHIRQEEGSLLTRAWELYHRAATANLGRARERFQACLRWASNAVDHGLAPEALKAYSCAISILPRVVFLGENIIGRIEALRQVNGLAASSVATALSLNDAASAIECLEQTRGILWLQAFQTRATSGKLALVPEGLRHDFVRLNRELENADRLSWSSRRRKAEELMNVITEIRAVPHLERFLYPPLLTEIQAALQTKQGYAVVIAPSDSSCDVLILGTPNGCTQMRLSTVNVASIQHLVQRYAAACTSARMAQRNLRAFHKVISAPVISEGSACLAVLSELWIVLARPILEATALLNKSTITTRKRLWWCPIGVLSALPLHAAGIYEGSQREYVGAYVVSSYAPTLSVLHRMLTETESLDVCNVRSSSMLLIAQADSAGVASLPHAQLEIDAVKLLVPPESLISTSQGMTVKDALAGMAEAHVLHLACHGHQDQDNPLNSGFELRDGRLTLAQLMRVHTPHARLAYLSACESAGMDESRPDEGLNLAGAMVFVGFNSVIATMWAMDDIDGPFVAERVYKRIFHGGSLDISLVPHAIDEAIQDLRTSGVSASRWATYVHIGV